MYFLSQLIIILTIANIITAVAAIIMERRNPAVSIAWVMVIFMLPVAGIILFFLLSQNISARKLYRLSEFEEQKIDSSLKNQIKEIKEGTYSFAAKEGRLWQDMIHLNQLYGRAYYSQNNKVDILTDGLRCLKLEACGYKVSCVEDCSPLDTPKNLLIKAKKVSDRDPKAEAEYRRLLSELNVRPSIEFYSLKAEDR